MNELEKEAARQEFYRIRSKLQSLVKSLLPYRAIISEHGTGRFILINNPLSDAETRRLEATACWYYRVRVCGENVSTIANELDIPVADVERGIEEAAGLLGPGGGLKV